MKKIEKNKILVFIDSLHQAHEEIKKALEEKNIILVQRMLSECQQFAYELGNIIEKQEGEGHVTISYLEEYCEMLFQVYGGLEECLSVNSIYKRLKKQLLKIENSIKNDIAIKKEIVFFPYKASMWDSLESIYLAAKQDSNYDVYCVPIPYYDMNPDRSFGKFHYEGGEYPADVKVTDWKEYNFEEREPDVIYIHNPYDDCNYVTSVHPRYYSANLKKYTETLVYVPYYNTSGGMGKSQSLCPAYIHADYIVIQSPKLRSYFDRNIPGHKFLPLGSPKFDRIIRKCKNPQSPPDEWKQKMEGKKVYFYNTSISGMLENTENFLKKMRYVFSCFEKRKDVCLLWRPHPLLETTFDSMRIEYKTEYLSLKRDFFDKKLGIFDTTSDVSDAIALSHAYIGDEGTSLISLFGIAGKPIFILNNRLHSEPDKESWRGEIDVGFDYKQDRFSIVQGNKLYVSEPLAYDYKYLCDLSEDVHIEYYNLVLEVDNKFYICPRNKPAILVIDTNEQKKYIELEKVNGSIPFFSCMIQYEKYIILLPAGASVIVRYDTKTGDVKYLKDDVNIICKSSNGIVKTQGCGIKDGKAYLVSPIDRKVYSFDIETLEHTIIELPVQPGCGYMIMWMFQEWLWMSSCNGERVEIVCWNPDTKETRVYDQFPEGFECIDPVFGKKCFENPFFNGIFYENILYLTPFYANMYIRLDIHTGEMTEWSPPFIDGTGEEYFYTTAKSRFLQKTPDERGMVKIFSYPKRTIYEMNIETGECDELNIHFNVDELKLHERGFFYYSDNLKYCCYENSFNSIRNFLDGNITGNHFDREKQIEAYREIATNHDGTCGVKVHEFISEL